MPKNDEGLPVRRHLIIAVVLLGCEVLLGIGLIGGAAIFITPLVLFSAFQNRPHVLKRLKVAAIYACLGIATLALLVFNWRLAERRAVPVIDACKQFRIKEGPLPQPVS